jgi:hypothetical protein
LTIHYTVGTRTGRAGVKDRKTTRTTQGSKLPNSETAWTRERIEALLRLRAKETAGVPWEVRDRVLLRRIDTALRYLRYRTRPRTKRFYKKEPLDTDTPTTGAS